LAFLLEKQSKKLISWRSCGKNRIFILALFDWRYQKRAFRPSLTIVRPQTTEKLVQLAPMP
jgi:hypothetical protein